MFSNFKLISKLIITLVWTLLFFTCYGQDETEELIRRTTISIRPTNFETILHSKSPFIPTGDGNENKGHDMLNAFSKYLIPFDFRNEADASLQQLKRICRETAMYNLKMYMTALRNTSKLELLISVVPHGGFTEQVELVAAIIRETNEICNGTVSAFMINYRFQRMGEQTVPLVNKDIVLSHQIIKSQFTNMTFGIIIDVRNCYGSDRHLLKLPWKLLDMVIIRATNLAEQNLESFRSTTISCGLQLEEVEETLQLGYYPLVGFVLPIYSELSVNTTTFRFSRTYITQQFAKAHDIGVIGILEAELAEYQSNLTTDPVMRTLEAQENWLNVDVKFNPEFTGTSINVQHQSFIQHEVAPPIWNSFCKVLLHEPTVITENFTKSYQFLRDFVFKYVGLLLAPAPESQCDPLSKEIFVAVNAFQDVNSSQFEETNIALLMKLTTLARMVAQNHTNVPSLTFLLNWRGCYGLNVCDGISEKSILFQNASKDRLFPVADVVQKQTHPLQNLRTPKVGIMIHWSVCHHFLSAGANGGDHGDYFQQDGIKVDTVAFQMYVHLQDILDQGALKVSMVSIARLQYCSSPLHGIAKTPSLRTTFHIDIVGCVLGSSNITELMQVTRFWELISQWGASVENTIIIGPAIQDVTTAHSLATNCSRESSLDLTRECGCGWWRGMNKPGDAPHANNWTFETKKSIARKRFEDIHRTKSKKDASDQTSTSYTPTQVLVAVAIIAMLITCVAVILILRYRNKRQLLNRDVTEFFTGRHTLQRVPNNENNEVLRVAQSQPYNRELYEIPSFKFEIDYSGALGGGEYGVVYPGTVNHGDREIHVAVKMPKKFDSHQNHSKVLAIKGLISEIKVLSYIGAHPYVIQLVGAYTTKLITGKLCVFLELCELGSLKNYLRSNGNTNEENVQPSTRSNQRCDGTELKSSSNCGASLHGLSKELRRWSREIALGMEFIASKNIVHADLATRNILLNSERCAKISDFGLSRRMYDYFEYVKQEAAPLPCQWMAPESLRRLVFNEKTDVWAFGVTLWEMYTLGDEPYPGLSWEVNFPQMLECGIRLEEPRCNEKGMYGVMKRCWSFDPGNRPCFSELLSILAD